MIKIIPVLLFFFASVFISCNSKNEKSESSKNEGPGSDKKEQTEPVKSETPESIALAWCDLNGKVHAAAEGPAKEAAIAARKKFETDMQEKFKDNQVMLDNVGKAIEGCEDASEGRK